MPNLDRVEQQICLPRSLPGAHAGGGSAGCLLAARWQKLRLRFTILLVLLYYVLSYTGIALGKQDKMSPFFAVWSANLLFAGAGVFLLWQMASGGRVLNAITSWFARSPKPAVEATHNGVLLSTLFTKFKPRSQRAKARNVFPRILDEYVVREFLNTFFLVLFGL